MKTTQLWALPFTVFMGLILAAGMAGATTYLFDDVGWGWNFGGYEDSNYIVVGANQAEHAYIYFQLPSAGVYNISYLYSVVNGGVSTESLNRSTNWDWSLASNGIITTNTGLGRIVFLSGCSTCYLHFNKSSF